MSRARGTTGSPHGCSRGLALSASTVCLAPTVMAMALLALVSLAQTLAVGELQHGGSRAWSGVFAMVLYAGVGIGGWGLIAAVGVLSHTAGLLLAEWARRLGSSAMALVLAAAHGVMLLVDVAYLGVLAWVVTGLARTAAERM